MRTRRTSNSGRQEPLDRAAAVLVGRVDVALSGRELLVPQEPHHDLAAGAAVHQARAEAVPERVHAIGGQASVARNPVKDGALRVGRHVAPVLPLEHTATAATLRGVMLGERAVQATRHRHVTGHAALRRALLSAHQVVADGQLALVEVDVAPPQRAHLARPRSAGLNVAALWTRPSSCSGVYQTASTSSSRSGALGSRACGRRLPSRSEAWPTTGGGPQYRSP